MPSPPDLTPIKPLADKLAFVDVETTGASPATAAITEVAIVTVRGPWPEAGPPLTEHWSSLVRPHKPLPPEIRFLTGIEPDMLVDAPPFEAIADEIEQRLAGAVFIAHHARFDYGFIKAEMVRAGKSFQCRTLCTVRLSRALHPERDSHTLDAVILDNHLHCPQRHRASGDALVLWQFLLHLLHTHGVARVLDTARQLISRPNLPAHLNISSMEALPASAGIYFFHGLNKHPLYIGKSINIRQRVASHFCNDYMSARGIRLASETRRLTWQETPGEFSALLAEIQAIKQYQPAHNRALRSQSNAWFVVFADHEAVPQFKRLAELNTIGLTLGPFASRSAARTRLIALAREHHWCLASMKLERQPANTPCFARQLGRCHGCCVGQENPDELAARIKTNIQEALIAPWPDARLLIVEENPARDLFSWHIFNEWHLQQTGHDEPGMQQTFATAATTESGAIDFDRHVYTLLTRMLKVSPAESLQKSAKKSGTTKLPRKPLASSNKAWQTRKRGETRLRWLWLSRPGRPDAAPTTNAADRNSAGISPAAPA